ncbi:MAG TPA: type III secretion system chaperone [Ramlibacter sp.]|nr:type III secretion system chaperone [Ramlibacter sp.]
MKPALARCSSTGLNVSFHAGARGSLTVSCVLGHADPDDSRLQALLLHANFFGDRIGACGVGVDASGHVSLVQRFASTDMSFPWFHESLERFTTMAQGVHASLSAASHPLH